MDSPREEEEGEAAYATYLQEEYKRALSIRDLERASKLREQLKVAGILVD